MKPERLIELLEIQAKSTLATQPVFHLQVVTGMHPGNDCHSTERVFAADVLDLVKRFRDLEKTDYYARMNLQ